MPIPFDKLFICKLLPVSEVEATILLPVINPAEVIFPITLRPPAGYQNSLLCESLYKVS